MRNLKRALSLTLASVMLLGMMVLGTSAASYPDVTDEHNVEAIEVLQAIGVMTGSNSGNFNPDAKVSRIEMAIVMANLLDLDVNYFQGQNTFSDVPEWASGYVNACAASGIVTGVGGGRFGTGNVTATQAALMMLKALGYFQYNSDFGDNWARATALKASQIRLFEGINAQDNTQLTRNQVAQLALNTLQATVVDAEDNTLSISGGAGETSINVSGGQVKYIVRTSGKDFAKAISDAEVAQGSSISGLYGYTVELGEQLYNGDLRKDTDVRDDFKRPGVRWTYKTETVGTYPESAPVATYTKKVTAADIYKAIGQSTTDKLADGTYTLYTAVDGDLSRIASGHNTIDAYSSKNDTYKVNNSGNGMVTEVYVSSSDKRVDIISYNTWLFKAAGDYSSSRNTLDVVSAGDTSGFKVTLSNKTLDGDDFPVIKDVKSGDYLLITGVVNGNRYDVKDVKVAELLTGKVDSYKKDDSVSLDGKSYSYSLKTTKTGDTYDASKGDGAATSDPVKSTNYRVGQEARVVLDAYGYIIAVDEAIVSNNYVFISEFAQPSGLSTGNVVGHAYFTDGTEKDITIREKLGSKDKAVIKGVGNGNDLDTNGDAKFTTDAGWYTYSVNSSDEYTLYRPEAKYNQSKLAYQAGAATPTNDVVVGKNNTVKFLQLNANGSGTTLDGGNATATTTWNLNSSGVEANIAGIDGAALRVSNKTIVIVDDGKDTLLYTGVKNTPDLKLTGHATTPGKALVYAIYSRDNSYADYIFISVSGNSSVSGGADSNLLYVVKRGNEVTGTDNVKDWEYKVLDGDEEKTVIADDDLSIGNYSGNGDVYRAYYKARANSDEKITDVDPIPAFVSRDGKFASGSSTGARITHKDGTLNLGGEPFIATADSKIVLVVMKDNTADLVNKLNLDKAAAYEAEMQSASVIGDRLKGYAVDFHYEVKTTGTDNTEIDQMYITITKAVADREPNDDTSVKSVKVKGQTATWDEADSMYKVSMTTVESTASAKALEVETTEPGAVVSDVKSGTTLGGVTTDSGYNTVNTDAAKKFYTFKVTATDGSANNTYEVQVTITDAPPEAGKLVEGGTMEAVETSQGADAQIKNMADGFILFPEDMTDALKSNTTSKLPGGVGPDVSADELGFFKFTKAADADRKTVTLTIRKTDSKGTIMYRENVTCTSNGGGGYFYVQLIEKDEGTAFNGNPSGTMGSLKTAPLTVGTYFWEITGAVDKVTNGTFTIG